MIIDSHAHVVMPPQSFRYMAELVGGRANPSTTPNIPDEAVRKQAEELVRSMDSVGTDIQFISPRPYLQMHSVKPARVTELWTRHCNDLIKRFVDMFPDRFRGVAGLPQFMNDSPAERCVAELKRCVNELGFVGTLLNPDPTEGEGPAPAGLGDPFWYPLYDAMTELDVPALIHSAGSCNPRESYTLKFINEENIAVISLLESKVFEKYPNLKIIVAHGGGAIPYQMGRFRSWAARRNSPQTFDEQLRKLYFDTCNYAKDSIELLLKVAGTDNVMFGTEKPGTGSARDPISGRDYDDMKPVIESIEWLTDEQRKNIFECNCTRVYTRAFRNYKA
ncbi:amidohydrolase family protein [Paraburkholderia sp. BL10I2N1]|uniref:amidohydrolase family protein n=1 Tax=Paraburkholderia sp. BL10I2N1 TaxID=1938796 RepID=UPI00105C5005|nr:amidohydrolase family protein [Paraburkholderia sp. BL10I2N1]TDN57940.1 4-oxalmesaconate hydratase [Paraburkholderia sp. BL10I2N1]